jgi:hypothetical protein
LFRMSQLAQARISDRPRGAGVIQDGAIGYIDRVAGRSLFVNVAVVALGMIRDPGCGGPDSPSSGPNAPCTRSKDCFTGLECVQGVCIAPDAGAAPSDAGVDAEAEAGG